MKIFSKILILILIYNCVLAQKTNENFNPLQLLAKPKNGTIHLRWAVSDHKLWQMGNKFGYTVVRKTIQKDDKIFKKGIDEKKIVIPPFSKDQWYDLAKKVDYAKIITGYFYEDPIQTTDTAEINNAWRGRLALSMLAADFSPDVAKGLGLAYQDSSVRANEKYVYTVFLNQQTNVISDFSAQYLGDIDKAYPSFPPNDLIDLDFVSHRTVLKWTLPTRTVYAAYVIERSDDGGVNFKRINRLPYFPVANGADVDFGTYSDSVATLFKTYQYRVRGIDPFSDLSDPSNVVSVFAYQTELIGGQNIQYDFPNESSVNLSWEYPDSLKVNIKGFDIYKTTGLGEPVKVNSELMDGPILRYIAKLNPLDEILYFFVDAIDLRGKSSRSNPVSVTIIDSIAPVKVQHLGGELTKSGVASICWGKNKDLDLYGYEVYRAEGYEKNSMFLVDRVSKSKTVLLDTIDMGTKSPKVHYILYAMDNHSNLSVNSDTLTLIRSDVFPPEPPSFSNAYPTDSSIVIEWDSSKSIDVVKYNLYRQILPDTTKQMVLSFEKTKYTNYFSDEEYKEGQENIYILEAVDGENLTSGEGCKRNLRLPVPLRRPPVDLFELDYSKKEKQATLTWKYKTRVPVKEYLVFRKSENDDDFSNVATLEADKSTYVDKDLPEKQMLTYRIFAVCEDKTRSSDGKEIVIKTK